MAFAEEYKLDLSEIDKKPYHLGGYLEFRPVLNGLDRNAALYQVKFYNQDVGNPWVKPMENCNWRAAWKKGWPGSLPGSTPISRTVIKVGRRKRLCTRVFYR
jgi:hypothetical protein